MSLPAPTAAAVRAGFESAGPSRAGNGRDAAAATALAEGEITLLLSETTFFVSPATNDDDVDDDVGPDEEEVSEVVAEVERLEELISAESRVRRLPTALRSHKRVPITIDAAIPAIERITARTVRQAWSPARTSPRTAIIRDRLQSHALLRRNRPEEKGVEQECTLYSEQARAFTTSAENKTPKRRSIKYTRREIITSI